MDWSRRGVVRMLLVGIWALSLLTLAYPARAQAQGGGGVHTVEPGETLGTIARQYGIDVSSLMEANGLSNADFVYVGQQLQLSGGGGGNQQSWQEESVQNFQSGNQTPGMAWEPQESQANAYPAGRSWEPPADQGGGYRQGMAYDPSATQPAGRARQPDGDWESQSPQSNSNRPGQSWEPPADQGGGYRQGMAYDPSATQPAGRARQPEDDRESQSPQSNSNRPGQSWEPEANGRGTGPDLSQNEEWGWVHSGRDPYASGNSWEPEPSARGGGDAELTGEKWIDINLSEQSMTVYQGDTVVRNFVISSGSSNYPTVTGTFYTYSRTELQDMSGGSEAAGTYYFQPDVPWVQYFFEDYAIHGAYWHNLFGTPIGHGCINIRVGESQWLYEWTGTTGIRVEVHY